VTGREGGRGIVNGPGTIDSGYRGEIKVIAINHGSVPVELRRGERIAQLVFQGFIAVDTLPSSERAHSGPGSTG
jgi:dUTP pyrophosphatase